MSNPPHPPQDDHDDDAIGFSSPQSLTPAPPPPLPGETRPEPEAFPRVAEEMRSQPVTDAHAFPAQQTFDPPPAAAAAPLDPFAQATRPFQRVVADTEQSLSELGGERLALAGYVFLIGCLVSIGAGALITLVLSRIARRGSEGWVRSHIDYQWNTAVAGVVGLIIGLAILPFAGLGIVVVAVSVAWSALRGLLGLLKFLKREPLRRTAFWSLP